MTTEAREMGPETAESVELAIARVRSGGMVIMVDDEDRENEGDFVMAAEDATDETDQLHGCPWTRLDLRSDGGA